MPSESFKHITVPVQPIATAYRLVCGACQMGEMANTGEVNEDGKFRHVCSHCNLEHFADVRFPAVYLDAEQLSPQVFATLKAQEKTPN